MRSVEIKGREFVVTEHALDRFHERECPRVSLEAAWAQMSEALQGAEIELTRPHWSGEVGLLMGQRGAHEYVTIDRRAVCPVLRGRIITYLSAVCSVGATVRWVA